VDNSGLGSAEDGVAVAVDDTLPVAVDASRAVAADDSLSAAGEDSLGNRAAELGRGATSLN